MGKTCSNPSATLLVHLTPGASRDEITGARPGADGRLEVQARVKAAPERGKANKALCALLAGKLGVSKGSVSVLRGATSRHKSVRVEGVGQEAADRWTARLAKLGR